MYSTLSPIARAISAAASHGVPAPPAISSASARTSSCGSVRTVCATCSTCSVARSTSTARSSQPSWCGSCVRGRTSTRLVAVSSSDRWGLRISNDETRVPK